VMVDPTNRVIAKGLAPCRGGPVGLASARR
jgi:hypothetical protein